MQCECRNEFEGAIRKHIEKSLPEGFTDYDASFQGYGFAIQAGQLTAPFYIEYKGEVQVPKKNGDGMKSQKIKTAMVAKYCPFCGKPADPEEDGDDE
tara:strand:- start:2984 stop:3274 length:291 start_codon:yes stop_codon:yes gene_type:complete